MRNEYPFTSITINRREVQILDIIKENAPAETDFERNTFDFIRRWFNGDKQFTLHTSGSTGTPKPILLFRHQLIASADLTRQALNLQPGENVLVCLDTRFIAGQMMLVRCFVVGMKVIATDPEANPLRNIPADVTLDFAAFVPYHVYHLLQSNDSSRVSKIRNIIIGGAPLAGDVVSALKKIPSSVFITYGMTETISHIALQRLSDGTDGSAFTTLPGISVSTDERGCLVIEAPYLSERQITNDVVELLDDTHFEWLGRWDNIINSGGVKISPEGIEEVLENVFREVNLHRRFVVSSVSDPVLGSKVVLVVEGELLDESVINTLFERIGSVVVPFKRPKKILVLPSFPQTNTGKIHRIVIKKIINERQQN